MSEMFVLVKRLIITGIDHFRHASKSLSNATRTKAHERNIESHSNDVFRNRSEKSLEITVFDQLLTSHRFSYIGGFNDSKILMA